MPDLATAVQWQQTGFKALAEDDGHGDTCGPIIMLDYAHVAFGHALTYAETTALRSRLIADKLMAADGTGMTMGEIVIAMQRYYRVETLKYVPWHDDSSVVLASLKTDLVAALEAGQAVALETNNALALPGNQPKIKRHFILAWGIDPKKGILIANGDLLAVLAAGKTVPAQSPVWVSWASLVAAQISSYAIWPAVEVPVLQISQVSAFFSQNADGSWHSIHNGKTLRGGMLDFYRSLPVPTQNGMSVLRLPITDEIAVGAPKAGTTRQPTFQVFEGGVLAYDPDRVIDTPPAASGSVYFWHVNDPRVLAVLAPPAPDAPVSPAVQSDLDKVDADLAALKADLKPQTT